MVAAAEDECPVHQNADNTITIKIVAKPGAKHNSVTDVSSDGVGVQIAAPPVDGEANTELLKYLASVLDLRKSEISLDKGSKSRSKSVRIIGSLSKEEVMRRLTSEISDKCS
ncbi:hypothetical protein C0Q70_20573 [Pomacea canaliculata]|uniref:Uncharacterized protein n=2 Tax=Pomacea canaliculata TaxID=400727 RepID=A0A2T7NFX7_POMCA|nr:hypothetical protein C0Q70_20573 [Pomacea canaliculata]